MKKYLILIMTIFLSSCSVVGKDNTPVISYKILSKSGSKNIELRVYEEMVLVSASMENKNNKGRKSAFMQLFDYISGENTTGSKIDMTAPVFMDENEEKSVKIPMTAPVFMDNEGGKESIMSFVLPENYTYKTAPKPTNPELKLHEVKNYKVAAITFSGLLSKNNINEHKEILEEWVKNKGYKITGSYKTAGYNPPFTIPQFRRNEVLIPIETD